MAWRQIHQEPFILKEEAQAYKALRIRSNDESQHCYGPYGTPARFRIRRIGLHGRTLLGFSDRGVPYYHDGDVYIVEQDMG